MLKSMTAYGRSVYVCSGGRFVAEIHSVNKRFLEVNVHLPRELIRFERDVKKWVGKRFLRGQVNVFLNIHLTGISNVSIQANLLLAKQLKNAWSEIESELDLQSSDSFDLSLIASEKSLFIYEEDHGDDSLLRDALQKVVNEALDTAEEMKNEEGEALKEDMEARRPQFHEKIDLISLKGPSATKRYKERLLGNLEEILPGSVENEERILREIAIFADRVDISEELSRFRIHLLKYKNLLEAENTAIGKTLEFLVQEMHREINTIGSKSSDVEISHLVVDIKSELEKSREQVQNVE
jgi:uncharacterized protein (TIGR00255 family)